MINNYQLRPRDKLITIDGLRFNVNLIDRRLNVEEFEGFEGSPGARSNSTPHLWSDGSSTEPTYRNARLITVAGKARCSTTLATIQTQIQLSSLLANKLDGVISLDDPWTGHMEARVQLSTEGVIVREVSPGVLVYRISLIANDPYIYGPLVERSVNTVGYN